jgi:hypothetical protein
VSVPVRNDGGERLRALPDPPANGHEGDASNLYCGRCGTSKVLWDKPCNGRDEDDFLVRRVFFGELG